MKFFVVIGLHVCSSKNSELSGIAKKKSPERTDLGRFRIIRLNKAAS